LNNVDDIQKTFAFIVELEKLKAVLRKNKPLGSDRYENSAEHSWQICLAAISFAPQVLQEMDVSRVIEMLLVHDIPEIDVGDTIVYAGKSVDDEANEMAAAKRLFGVLGNEVGEKLFTRWEEFEAGTTLEARYARAIDRLLPVLQNVHNNGQSWRENGIKLEQVLKMNERIGVLMPGVWAALIPKIRDCFTHLRIEASEHSPMREARGMFPGLNEISPNEENSR
jgi:putative hydrolases of HD superfamily